MAFPRIRQARERLPKEIEVEMRAAAPTPVRVPTVLNKETQGSVRASPQIAKAPAPCPMNIRSTMFVLCLLQTVPVYYPYATSDKSILWEYGTKVLKFPQKSEGLLIK